MRVLQVVPSLPSRTGGPAFDPERRSRMGERGYERIRPRTNEWWAGEFEAMVQCIVDGVKPATRIAEEART